jgi:hypothetical protein
VAGLRRVADYERGGTTGRASFFVGLGPPDGGDARVALEDAVRRAKA